MKAILLEKIQSLTGKDRLRDEILKLVERGDLEVHEVSIENE